jgi:TetR/AcrR family transcriptional repressor for divergent bdcA
MTTNTSPTRGRPRRFNPDDAIATAQQLFHVKGYDALSVADLTKALGINPPSFYAAFGSKAGLYARVLDRYAAAGAIPLAHVFHTGRPLAASLAALLEEAARHYAADPDATGCIVPAAQTPRRARWRVASMSPRRQPSTARSRPAIRKRPTG